jgi:hypothetical protein
VSALYPEPTRAERRAWAAKKAADRERAQARFRAGPVTSRRTLEAMLDGATPVEVEAINARIQERQMHRRAVNARQASKMRARTPEELARDQADFYPTGTATCRTCGRVLPLADFAPALHKRRGIQNHCADCWAPTDA